MRYKIGIVCLLALPLALLLIDAWLAFRNYRYSQLFEEYECGYLPNRTCKADFDGDGQFTEIKVQYRHDTLVELPPRFNGTEGEVVMNAYFMDGSFRTHFAIARHLNRDRLLVYEGRADVKDAINVVYERNANQLVETTPTEVDEEILAAMASRDDTGTFHQWIAYGLLAWPVRVVYILLFVSAALLFRRSRTNQL
jgi:hypothetical protein